MEAGERSGSALLCPQRLLVTHQCCPAPANQSTRTPYAPPTSAPCAPTVLRPAVSDNRRSGHP
eukprot:11018094-Alexandrium_andersonii.AAC.2